MAETAVHVLGYARTPFGRFQGALRGFAPPELGALAMRAALADAGVAASAVEAAYCGIGLLAGGELASARLAVMAAGLPEHTPSFAVDRACCSGMTAVGLAAKDIRLGEADIVLAGGYDVLSRTPYLAPRAPPRWPGDLALRDPLVFRLAAHDKAIARYTGEEALAAGVTREAQDAWALQSHRRWQAAEAAGAFAGERFAVDGALATDEGPRADASLEALAKLPPLYDSPTVTAGNAPGLSDGAAFLVLASAHAAERLGVAPRARLLAYAQVADGPTRGTSTPALAIEQALARAGRMLPDLTALEINEAYAATPLVSTLKLARGDEALAADLRLRTNAKGGAVAIGHPLGASGARLVMTLAETLRGATRPALGAAAICGGFGQGDALLLETV